jgi:hypothetical protein
LSNYDEKVLEIMTLYGLPMVQIHMPITTTVPPGDEGSEGGGRKVENPIQGKGELRFTGGAGDVSVSRETFSFTYISRTVGETGELGTYYVLSGTQDVHVSGARPIQPRVSRDVHLTDTIAHGALMVGGSFGDRFDFDPFVSRIVTDQLYAQTEPVYPTQQWYPVQPGTVNRFLAIDGQSRERLVVVPAQFQATPGAGASGRTTGTLRLYDDLTYDVYHAPFTATDFIAPSIWQVEAISTTSYLQFRVQVADDRWEIRRTVVLYRTLDSGEWSVAELDHDPVSGWAEGKVGPVEGPIAYFAQAVDRMGNVALALDHGNPFTEVEAGVLSIYLPLIYKDS